MVTVYSPGQLGTKSTEYCPLALSTTLFGIASDFAVAISVPMIWTVNLSPPFVTRFWKESLQVITKLALFPILTPAETNA